MQTQPLDRILIGMHDYYTGLDAASFSVVADLEVNGVKAGGISRRTLRKSAKAYGN